MKDIIKHIRAELLQNVDPVYRRGAMNYFKEGIVLHGVRLPAVRTISAKYYSQLRGLDKKEIFVLCDRLLSYGTSEERTIAFDWAWHRRREFQPSDFKTLERWLRDQVNNWGGVDDLCRRAFGFFICRYPQFLPKVFGWTKARKWHMRRAAAVILIAPAKLGRALPETLKTSDAVLKDEHYLVQKGYGWLLKEAYVIFPREVFGFVMKNKDQMPRTALRYAIEKMPPVLCKKAMAKYLNSVA
ncbi:DNA alkylation repair protein [candidate division TA06 bacterium]|uniref:DNA alkylation repair protein n=1 Tax=candidate division TA06 bacterium TaxID=2250710 RepID=A0A933MLF5_UNCT6|nr:DNA alkylation repair protein [candidate division TA06 bacterium]